jgi:hypothetical protein
MTKIQKKMQKQIAAAAVALSAVAGQISAGPSDDAKKVVQDFWISQIHGRHSHVTAG